jgi:hypothetical protein
LSAQLRRLVVEFGQDGVQIRTLYRSPGGPGPSPKARRREVEQLVRAGLERTLEAIKDGPVEMVGTAGFATREDTLELADLVDDSQGSR